MSPSTIDLDNETTMHFWKTNQPQFNKPSLVLLHGNDGNFRWQFFRQVRHLSRRFNLYIPDLLFFGKFYTGRSDRSDVFQARCVGEGLKRLGVERFSVVGLSYGGFVAYRVAEIYREKVEQVVIISCGMCYEEDQKIEHFRKIGRNPLEFFSFDKPDDLRFLVNLSVYKYNLVKWVPDLFIREFINVICKDHRKEKLELVEHFLAKKADSNLPILTQDNVFPPFLAHQLQRHLGPKSRLEIIKNTGHAVNIDLPARLNDLIKSFVLGCYKL